MILYLVYMNVMYVNIVATTRSDTIADSAAVYAQSYDYKYNKAQAETMVNLLTVYNNRTSDFYNLSTGISFSDDKTLTVKCIASTPTFYPDLMGSDTVYGFAETSVTSVDIWGDVLVVPENIATKKAEAEEDAANNINSSDADLALN
jgi:hypothetical protein